MLDIAFHLNIADRIDHTSRLLRKAHGQGARLIVVGTAAQVEGLGQALWLMDPVGFLPHGRDGDAVRVMRFSPIFLTSLDLSTLDFQAEVLVNLGNEIPTGYDRYQRLIEVVSGFDPDVQQARARWKVYKAQGYQPTAHDMGASRQNVR